jgi:serine/threonine-protein kinase
LLDDTSKTGFDIGLFPLGGGSERGASGEPRQVTPLAQTTFDEANAEVSPDSKWLAYQSNESGQYEVYVRPFPEVDRGRWQVSTSGGTRPIWARSGKELFYLAPSGAVMSVAIEGGSTFRAGSPTRLFEGRYLTSLNFRTYDVSPDGQRFLMIKDAGDDQRLGPATITVVQHFDEELKRLVPVN